MSDEVNYSEKWEDEKTQCKNCVNFQSHEDKNACVPPDEDFEQALEKYGEVSPQGHCDFFSVKK